MGLSTIYPEDVDIAYDTIGDAGMTRCGEMRSDGERIYGLFKAGETLNLVKFVYISGYSNPDITVSLSANTTNGFGVPTAAATTGQYVWVLIRGTSSGDQFGFASGGQINVGDMCGTYFGNTFSKASTNIKKLVSLKLVPVDDTLAGAVHIVR